MVTDAVTVGNASKTQDQAPEPRRSLPNRRPNVSIEFEAEGRTYTVTIGFDPGTTQPREIFISDAKAGSGMDATLNDASILASLALQFGRTPRELAAAMSRLGAMHQSLEAAQPASPLGAALDILCRETAP
jgi:hypothetical protein